MIQIIGDSISKRLFICDTTTWLNLFNCKLNLDIEYGRTTKYLSTYNYLKSDNIIIQLGICDCYPRPYIIDDTSNFIKI